MDVKATDKAGDSGTAVAEPECDHIIGLSDGPMGSWLEYESLADDRNRELMDTPFAYCPSCGVKLK